MSDGIRPALPADGAGIVDVLEPIIRAGDSYALPPTWGRDQIAEYWFSPSHHVYVAEGDGMILGTSFIRPNQLGGGSHVANAGYATRTTATNRGIARALCEHSLREAVRLGFRAMQFNFVVASNAAAVHLWTSLGFVTVGRLPGAFMHPTLGAVDALVMYRSLADYAT